MGGWFLYGEYKDKNCDCVLKKYRHSTYDTSAKMRVRTEKYKTIQCLECKKKKSNIVIFD